MPFTITIAPPRCSAQGGRGFHCPRPANATYCEVCGTTDAITTHAVIDISAARAFIFTDLGDRNAITGPEDEICGHVLDLSPESGGTIGPLPDGTVIEVAPVTLPELATSANVPLPDYSQTDLAGHALATGRIIDAYNSRTGG